MAETLLQVEDLAVHYPVKSGLLVDRTVGYVYAVDDDGFAAFQPVLHHHVRLSYRRDRGRPALGLDIAHCAESLLGANTYTTTASCHCCDRGCSA